MQRQLPFDLTWSKYPASKELQLPPQQHHSPPHLQLWLKGAKTRENERGRDQLQGDTWQRSTAAHPFSGEGENSWWGMHERTCGTGIELLRLEEGREEGLLFNCQPWFYQQIGGRAVTGVQSSRWPNCEISPLQEQNAMLFLTSLPRASFRYNQDISC